MNEKIIKYCVENNDYSFNLNKAMEEASEFMEAALKRKTKDKNNSKRPSVGKVIKEYADLQYRGFIYLCDIYMENTDCTFEEAKEKVNEIISKHITLKLILLSKYKQEGKYTNEL